MLTRFNQNDRTSQFARKLASDLATTNPTVIYEVPSGMSARIVSMWLASNHNNNVAVRVFHTRGSEAAGTTNALLYDVTASANTTVVYDAPIFMAPGDRIWVRVATASTVCITLYGEEQ
ncbi:MAG: hypothetical protein ACK52I_25255 [Pseudomonadota bacterium]|jgi:hypothetical protein